MRPCAPAPSSAAEASSHAQTVASINTSCSKPRLAMQRGVGSIGRRLLTELQQHRSALAAPQRPLRHARGAPLHASAAAETAEAQAEPKSEGAAPQEPAAAIRRVAVRAWRIVRCAVGWQLHLLLQAMTRSCTGMCVLACSAPHILLSTHAVALCVCVQEARAVWRAANGQPAPGQLPGRHAQLGGTAGPVWCAPCSLHTKRCGECAGC